jgi:phosphoribosylanthranilate isomerase
VRPRVKICGLTRPEDVALAVALGADAVGLIFAPSKRQLTVDQARALAQEVPVWVNRVGVFGPDQREEAAAIAEACRLDTLQFHGEPDLPFLAAQRGRFKVVQVIGVGQDETTLAARLDAVSPHVDGLLLDTGRPGQLGGTGEAFAWDLLASLTPTRPLIVAGGLKPENVGRLVAAHAPWGLDVSSGVEAAPGIKDPARLRAFFEVIATARR